MTSDEAFLDQFERAAISKDDWDHRAHVRVIHQLLVHRSFAEALDRVRAGIPRLNRAHGVPNTDTGGDHETLTIAWTCLVAERMGGGDGRARFDDFIAAHPDLLRRDLVLEHYSEQRLFSVRARREPLPPDRRVLAGFERAPEGAPPSSKPSAKVRETWILGACECERAVEQWIGTRRDVGEAVSALRCFRAVPAQSTRPRANRRNFRWPRPPNGSGPGSITR